MVLICLGTHFVDQASLELTEIYSAGIKGMHHYHLARSICFKKANRYINAQINKLAITVSDFGENSKEQFPSNEAFR